MVLQHFGLSHAPFQIAPETRFFFSGGKRMAILQALVEGLNQGRGIIEVTGVAGSGKTLMCRMMLERVPAERVLPVYLGDTSLLPNESLKVLAHAMNVVLPEGDQENALAILRQAALQLRQQGREVVVMVDEAQAMPVETFSVLHRLADTPAGWLFKLVFLGQPELDDLLSLPSLHAVQQNIVYKFKLEPLSVEDVARYIAHRMRIASWGSEPASQDLLTPPAQDVFTPAAVIAIADVSLGVPRRINLFAEKALHIAAQQQAPQVTVNHVLGEATANVQMTPAASSGTAPETSENHENSDAANASVAHHLNFLAPEVQHNSNSATVAVSAVTETLAETSADAFADTFTDKFADTLPNKVAHSLTDTVPASSILSDPPQHFSSLVPSARSNKRMYWLSGVFLLVVGAMLTVFLWRMQLFENGLAQVDKGAHAGSVVATGTVPQAPLDVPAEPTAPAVVSVEEPSVARVVVGEANSVAANSVAGNSNEVTVKPVENGAVVTPVSAPSTTPAEPPKVNNSAAPPVELEPKGSAKLAQSNAVLPAGIIDLRLAAGKQWLETSPAGHGSIQLFVLASSGDEGLRRFLRQHTSPGGEMAGTLAREKIYLYLSTLKGQLRMSVLYGDFPSRTAALQAISTLPEEIRALKPYARSVQGLREEIMKTPP